MVASTQTAKILMGGMSDGYDVMAIVDYMGRLYVSVPVYIRRIYYPPGDK
jgi:hypothetical protein